jgi:Glutathione-dependent formaldehyde-activating enzyme
MHSRFVRYRMTTKPLFVHCCHCRWCQRETGASFALNALIEADRVQLHQGEGEVINTRRTAAKARKSHAVPGVGSRFGATTPEPVTQFASFASERSTNPTASLPTSIFSPRRSNHGSCFRPTFSPWPSTTRHPSCGPRKASSAKPYCWRGRNHSSPNASNHRRT